MYLHNGIRITIYSGDRTKDDQDIMVFRKYVLQDLTFEQLADKGTIPREAIPLFRKMIGIGFNAVSYTHLDVYKRQSTIWRDSPAMPIKTACLRGWQVSVKSRSRYSSVSYTHLQACSMGDIMKLKSDYHIHTWYSDGTMKPTDVVRMYKENQYDVIAITDHDGVDGIMEAEIAGEALQIKVIPGIEFGTDYDLDGRELELHILGYHIDTADKALTLSLIHICFRGGTGIRAEGYGSCLQHRRRAGKTDDRR